MKIKAGILVFVTALAVFRGPTRRPLAALVQRLAESFKVQTVLFWLGLRRDPPGAATFYPSWRRLVPPRELWVGPDDPIAHFLRWPFEYRAYLTLLCGMRRDASVLELACNHGRTMLGLIGYIHPPGRYEGLDILPKQIGFAQQAIHMTHPAFNFTLADIYNGTFNPDGRLRAESFRFPYADRSFDIVYAASLFTHLVPPAAENYLRESRRVVQTGGYCLFSFFVLDYYCQRGPSAFPGCAFPHALAGYDQVAVRNPAVPEDLIAYEAALIHEMAAKAGFDVRRIIRGYWSDPQDISVNEQDLVLLEAV